MENLQQTIAEMFYGLFGRFCFRTSGLIRLISTWHIRKKKKAVFKALFFRICCTYTCFWRSTPPHVSLQGVIANLCGSVIAVVAGGQWAQCSLAPLDPRGTPAAHPFCIRGASFLPPQTLLFYFILPNFNGMPTPPLSVVLKRRSLSVEQSKSRKERRDSWV